MNLLEVKNLYVYYGNNLIVENINFNLEYSKVIGIVGPSGSGKSTIIWSILGMIEEMGGSFRGNIKFKGKILDYRPTWNEISIVPQLAMNSFNPVLKIKDSINELHQFSNMTKKDFDKNIEKLLKMVGLENNILNSYPHQLSGGMKQRIAIVCALCTNPDLLILDESTTGLDVLVEAEILYYLKNIKEFLNISIIFVSHDKRLVSAFCDEVINMKKTTVEKSV